MLGEYLIDPFPLKDKPGRSSIGNVHLDMDLVNNVRSTCPKLPFTETIAMILESRVSGASEAVYRSNLRQYFGGVIEQRVATGYVDLVTPCKKIIEVKKYQRYSHAIGQILCYKPYFPDYLPYIALFGKKFTSKKTVLYIAETYNIGLIWMSTKTDSIEVIRDATTERLHGKEIWEIRGFGATSRKKIGESSFSLPM